MRALIISGGTLTPDFAAAQHQALQPELVIAADAGLVICEAAGIRPDHAVGDFDSLPIEVARRYGIPDIPDRSETGLCEAAETKVGWIERYPSEKDWGDTELAARRAVEMGADEIWILGGTGTRFDHMLANVALLYRLGQDGVHGFLLDPHNRIRLEESGSVTIRRAEQYGTYVSFAAYGGPVRGLTLTGFRYPLTDRMLLPGDETLTLSNEIVAEESGITWDEGTLLIVESKD